MSFTSCSYAILFAAVMLARLTIGRDKTERPFVATLLAAGVILYAWDVPIFLLILLSSALVDYLAGLRIGGGGALAARSPATRRAWLLASLAVNLGLLACFKYADFLVDLGRDLLAGPGSPPPGGASHLVLPMGISFYTFASLSYTIDVHRREIRPVRSFREFFLFIGFFPHLVAGPIVRGSMFLPQLARRRRPRLRVLNRGCFLIIRGLFLKAVCADNLAPLVDRYWREGSSAPTAEMNSTNLLLLAVAFACQIFCDFEGYTSMARGTAYLLGYRLPENFDNPYLAGSFRNFWERWHITLSRWLRDYLYIPLGGGRRSPARTRVNLMVVMVLGGRWHGASTTFLAWGALHGAALAIERRLGLHRPGRFDGRPALAIAWYLVVQAVVLASWVFFRCTSARQAVAFLANFACLSFSTRTRFPAWGLIFTLPVVAMHVRGLLVERGLARPPGPTEEAILAGAMLSAVLTCHGDGNAFIYFQF
jgi:alginate O-acetyltransferase complex protein AlgI